MLLITVPNPCHEDWNKMAPAEKGAFCKACSKTVVDFTSMTDDEIRNYFIRNKGQKTCGHFRNDQLANTGLTQLLKEPIPLWKKIVAAVLILFESFLPACKESTTGKISPPRAADVTHTAGINSPEPEKAAQTKAPDRVVTVCTVTNGFAAPVSIETTGEVIPEEPSEATVDTLQAKPDTVTKIIPLKNACDGKDTTFIYDQPG